jgi:hypothetical protein
MLEAPSNPIPMAASLDIGVVAWQIHGFSAIIPLTHLNQPEICP